MLIAKVVLLNSARESNRAHRNRIIAAGLPGTAAWAIGLLVGINMIFGGSALIVMALHARDAAPRAA